MYVIAAELEAERPLFLRDLASMRTTHLKQLAQQFSDETLDRIDLAALEKHGFASVSLEVFGLKEIPSRFFRLAEGENFTPPDRELRQGRPLRLHRPNRQPLLPPDRGRGHRGSKERE
mgnify:CR=1 FL=1